ncbi:MAG: Na+/H+ antiporter NhaA [Acidimicrobiia bacterium]
MVDERVHETWLSSDRRIPSRFVRPLLRFTQVEAAGGAVLLVAAVLALVWANLPGGESYERFFGTEVGFDLGIVHVEETVRDFVNDGLMAIFFFVVGLEIKRELIRGDLRDRKSAMLPAFGALGGMIFPALIFLAFVLGDGEATRGWGIPMATDIAFSVGVVALLGSRVSVGAKLFLLALAIVDDIGAILVIAIFYTEELALGWLGGAIGLLVVIEIAKRVGVRSAAFYLVVGAGTWFALLESGVHATIAGVALGLMTPAYSLYSDPEYRQRATWIMSRYDMDAAQHQAPERIDADAMELVAVARESVSPLSRLETAFHPWSSFVIVPIFALANAGIRFADIDVGEALTSPVALGVGVGLVVGKAVGVSLFVWLAVKLGLGNLPRNTTWTHMFGMAAAAGIGFTVSLFITELAFTDPGILDRAKLGIFVGSAIAGFLAYFVLRRSPKTAET